MYGAFSHGTFSYGGLRGGAAAPDAGPHYEQYRGGYRRAQGAISASRGYSAAQRPFTASQGGYRGAR